MTRREEFEFGDYVVVEQKRYGVPNEFYVHKVIGMLESNSWIDVPAQTGEGAKLHDTCEPVVSVICCGVDESKVVRYRAADCRIHQAAQPAPSTQVAKEDIAAAWIAGYYHAGYTNDGAYAIKTAGDFAAEWGAQPAQPEKELRHRIRVHLANRDHYSHSEFCTKLEELMAEQEAQPAQIPEGYVLVPVEPTQAMEEAAERAESRHVIADKRLTGGKDPQLSFKAAYAAMLAAAPGTKEGGIPTPSNLTSKEDL